MKTYDVIVIGAGVGTTIVFKALSAGLKVALIDKGKVGGTCLNVGCVPSKNLLFPADRVREIEKDKKLGIHANVARIDFSSIMERMRGVVRNGRNHLLREIRNSKNLDFYNDPTHFIDESVLKVKNDKIRGRKIFIASGGRPSIPSIKGLEDAGYLTNETVLNLVKRPRKLIILGGGYIAVEYGHFFASMGTEVMMVQRNKKLVPNEESEISDLLKKKFENQIEVYLNAETVEIQRSGSGEIVHIKNRETGREKSLLTETILVATGRRSNADLLRVEEAGIETDEANYIKVDDYLQTNKENIWALGDAVGKQMFTHAGDREAELAWHNATEENKTKMDFQLVPHAIFTYPQIASVGLTEEQAKKDYKILVGRAKYSDTVKGEAMMEEEGFAKAIVEKGTERILGFHIIGPEASILIQEVVNAMANKVSLKSIASSMHIFPTLSELIPETLARLE